MTTHRWKLLFLLLAAGSAGRVLAQTKGESDRKSATELADKIQQLTGAKPAKKVVPAGDPCAILSISDVQRVFPKARTVERRRELEKYGTTECGWKDAAGRVVIGVQESYSSGTAQEAREGWPWGFTDPLRPRNDENVRYETFPKVGVDAAGFVERTDQERGILGNIALMCLRQGEHGIMLLSVELPERDRTAALKALEDLGRVAAKRLR